MNSAPSGNSAVEEALSKVSRLATLPEMTTRILELIDNPEATADELEGLVSSDPVSTLRGHGSTRLQSPLQQS